MRVRLVPIINEIHRQAVEATRGDSLGLENARAIKELARSVGNIDQVGWGPEGGPRSDLSEQISSFAERLPDTPPSVTVNAAAWSALRERLQGMTALITPYEMGAFQERLRAWLEDYEKL
jgi:hypothetical protein